MAYIRFQFQSASCFCQHFSYKRVSVSIQMLSEWLSWKSVFLGNCYCLALIEPIKTQPVIPHFHLHGLLRSCCNIDRPGLTHGLRCGLSVSVQTHLKVINRFNLLDFLPVARWPTFSLLRNPALLFAVSEKIIISIENVAWGLKVICTAFDNIKSINT